MRPRRHLLSVALGFFAGLLVIAAVAIQVERWSRIDALRAPPVSQVGFWTGTGLLALVALLELMLARLPSGTQRAIAMTAVSGGVTIIGAVAGGAGAES